MLTQLFVFLLCVPWSIYSQELVKIPRGKVEAIWATPLKSKADKKLRAQKISVPSFAMMKYAVTVEEFRNFLEKNPQWKKENILAVYADASYLENFKIAEINPKSPMTNVSWHVASKYCESLGLQLPTVNQWEYVASASETKKNANNDEKFLKRILEWYGETKTESLRPVGSIYNNLYGVWDMHGLIWEWVRDFNTTFLSGESRQDNSMNKDMFCGAGSMSMTDKENYAAFMRFAFRSGLKGRSTVWNLGFRCVKENL